MIREALDKLSDTHQVVAERCDLHRSDLSRFLAGKRSISEPDLVTLAGVCGFRSRKERAMLVGLHRDREKLEWWLGPADKDLQDKADVYLEDSSCTVVSYAPHEIPPELRTDCHPGPGRVERNLGQGPHRTYYLGLPALRRLGLTTSVAQEQARLLFWLEASPLVTIRVVPDPGTVAPFRLFDLVEGRKLVKVDLSGMGMVLESLGDVRHHQKLIKEIDAAAINEEQTRLLLARIADP
ncbi:Scr1 family TA system antitoxin-like transcriptional regulator [Actinokineospora globicatena]|uniref:Scr1 family TA system antitoxin-like transcriptional regulator n=1 Tax=Actinokineospora globicatena TaxID=103729 RepID=UPI0020A534AE|nr:Scr1 family TA system antitoxin-like transcriptional regulator [Actinokineospora globicatena]